MSVRAITTLLLIEDNRGDVRLLQEMFNDQPSHDVRLNVVECMRDAETHLATHEVDIILLDLGLPDAQGLDAVRRTRIAAPRVPLVVLTGMDDELLAIHALQEGAQDYLIKGQIENRALPRALRYAIERKSMEEARKQTDEALRSSEARLRRLLDSNIIGVAFWSSGGAILNANELFLNMIGYSRRDLIDQNITWSALTPPGYAQADANAARQLAAAGTCAAYEKELIGKDGACVTVLIGSALLADASGSGSSFVLDITERKQDEVRLRLQSLALNAAGNSILITDRELRIVWVNPAFTELTGYTGEEALGHDPQELLDSGLHTPSFLKGIRDTIFAGKTWRGEMMKRRKDGSLYPEAQTITPVKDEEGSISHFISITNDLTSQRLMEAQLRQAQKMEAVGQLAAGVAHEFNNILQGLMSMATITQLRAISPEVARIGGEMEAQIRRGASVTQQLLLFSRSQALEKSTLDVHEQLEKVSVLLRRLIPENIRIVLEPATAHPSVEGNAGQMQQVLLNLAINARDAMPDGGTLTLRAGENGDEVFLEIEDTGHGLDEKTRAHIFEPFFTTKEAGHGTGLGLSVVYGIVEEHLGRIDVESGVGRGSRFRVVLPASASEIDANESLDEPALPTGRGTVLLVEDEEGVRAGVGVLLEMIGYDVISLRSGEEAMAMTLEVPPDLLLSDVTLAGMNGSTLGEHLRERWPTLRVVLMSGYIDESVRANAIAREWHFLQKPFGMKELASRVHAAMAGERPAILALHAQTTTGSAGALLPARVGFESKIAVR